MWRNISPFDQLDLDQGVQIHHTNLWNHRFININIQLIYHF